MLRRFTFWLRCTWQKLPVQLSLLGWPPLLSHSLAFIVGTLVLQRGGGRDERAEWEGFDSCGQGGEAGDGR